MARLSVFTVLLLSFLLIIIDGIDAMCRLDSGIAYCDTVDDLYNYNYPPRIVTIEKPNNTEFQKLQPVSAQVAQNAFILKIIRTVDEIPEDGFINFTEARQIHLIGNKLEEIPTGAFKNLNNMNYLAITHSNLGTVKAGIFNNLRIQTLLIEAANISKIEAGTFFDMQSLHTLSLKHNLIKSFSALEYITRASFMQVLRLDYNQLGRITKFMLEGLNRLTTLSVAHNRITSIEPKAFDETPGMTVLILSYNSLRTVTGEMLPSVGHLRMDKLLLDHNMLMFLPSNFLFRVEFIRYISIGGNPWQCPCLDLILEWLSEKDVKFWCDDSYFSGKRPICIVSPRCFYQFEYDFYFNYNSTNAFYPKEKECPL